MLSSKAFNGYHVTFYNHETRTIETESYPDIKSVEERGFMNGLPSPEELADSLYNDFADVVGKITDNDGNLLLDNEQQMLDTYKEHI